MNYATWKVQCRMALVKEGLWSIVSGTETEPVGQVAKFRSRMDRALATIVLAIEPSLLYLLEDPQDPTVVLEGHYQKKTLANILALRRRLYSLKLGEGESMQDHIKRITEIFGDLSIVGDEISNEDRVVHLLASLPESYNVLATALEWNATVPKMEVLIERLLHEEKKQKERSGPDNKITAYTAGDRIQFKETWAYAEKLPRKSKSPDQETWSVYKEKAQETLSQ